MPRKLFITGATGYIGESVLARFLTKFPDLEVTALLRNPKPAFRQKYPSVKVLQGTFEDSDTIKNATEAADIVIHTGDTDHAGCANAILAGAEARKRAGGPELFVVHLTGTGCISDLRSNSWDGALNPRVWDDVADMDEIYNFGDEVFHHTINRAFMDASDGASVKTVCICPPDIYGRGAGDRESFLLPLYIPAVAEHAEAFYLGKGENMRAVSHIDDTVDLFELVLRTYLDGGHGLSYGPEGFYFAVAGEVPWRRVAEEVCRIGKAQGWLPDHARAESWDKDRVQALTPAEFKELMPIYALYVFGSNSRAISTRATRLGWTPKHDFWAALEEECRRLSAKTVQQRKQSVENLNIVVVGGGPIGLITAAALAQQGHSVTVLERAPDLRQAGGIITVGSNASRVLYHLGATADLLAASNYNNQYRWKSYKSEKPIITIVAPQPWPETAPRVCCDRPALQRVAHTVAVRWGVKVVFGRRVVRLDVDAPTVWSTDEAGADEQEHRADLIVGADGIKSTVRRLMFPELDVEARLTSHAAYVMKIPIADLEHEPLLASYLVRDAMTATLGPHSSNFGVCLPDGHFVGMFVDGQYSARDSDDGSTGWIKQCDVAEVRDLARSRGFIDMHTRFLDHARDCYRWRFGAVAPLPAWHRGGRCVLVGDACHAMLPFLGQGGGQGMEDGMALAHILARSADVPEALRRYEAFRRPRVEIFVTLSAATGARCLLPDGPEQELRDAMMRSGLAESADAAADDDNPTTVDSTNWDEVEPDPDWENGKEFLPPFQKWAFSYDVVEEVKALFG